MLAVLLVCLALSGVIRVKTENPIYTLRLGFHSVLRQWHTVVKAGSQEEEFTVNADSTFGGLWVPDIQCQTAWCKTHRRFDPSESSTWMDKQTSLSRWYLGKYLSTREGTDNIKVQNEDKSPSFEEQGSLMELFTLDTNSSYLHQFMVGDGLLGLDLMSLQVVTAVPKVYGFSLGAAFGSKVTFGGVDSSDWEKVQNSVSKPLLDRTGKKWPNMAAFSLEGISYGDQSFEIGEKTSTVIDTGLNFMEVPKEFMQWLLTFIHATPSPPFNRLYKMPCDSRDPMKHKNVKYSFGNGVEVSLTIFEYSIPARPESNVCYLLFNHGLRQETESKWTIGVEVVRQLLIKLELSEGNKGTVTLAN